MSYFFLIRLPLPITIDVKGLTSLCSILILNDILQLPVSGLLSRPYCIFQSLLCINPIAVEIFMTDIYV